MVVLFIYFILVWNICHWMLIVLIKQILQMLMHRNVLNRNYCGLKLFDLITFENIALQVELNHSFVCIFPSRAVTLTVLGAALLNWKIKKVNTAELHCDNRVKGLHHHKLLRKLFTNWSIMNFTWNLLTDFTYLSAVTFLVQEIIDSFGD